MPLQNVILYSRFQFLLFVTFFLLMLPITITLESQFTFGSPIPKVYIPFKLNYVDFLEHISKTQHLGPFLTSPGKSRSNGFGGTVKRDACRASPQRPLENQITTPLPDWCQKNLN
ncbi:hypothetical protein FF38_00951 [Lucilia cuprina]|uniref:Transmembrane protein n=1 Tax=Lucilia cuprina TaxID=7375 RepID=A0A0L0C007_LUCCU|nr:hypothetical protein FF38_00951 [Lucilia cuprina]